MKRVFTLLIVFFIIVGVERASAQVLSLGPDITVCPDQMVILDAGSGYSSYLWNTGSTTQSITVTLAGMYWVQVTTGTGVTMGDTVHVMYYPPLEPLTVTVVNPYCFQPTGSIIINEPQELEYLYSIDGGLTFQEEEEFTGLTSGVYNVIAEDTYGCAGLIATVILWETGPLIDNVETTPATGSQSNGTLTIYATGESLTYSINGSAPQASPYFTGLPAGVYHCNAKDIFGCIVTREATVALVTGATAEAAGNGYFTVSPNPLKGTGRIIFSNTALPPESVTITNMQGNVVKRFKVTQGNELQLDHPLSPGLYFVSVLVNGKRYVEKLVVY